MTFFELIRSSLLADALEKKTPSELVRAVLSAWWKKDQEILEKDKTFRR